MEEYYRGFLHTAPLYKAQKIYSPSETACKNVCSSSPPTQLHNVVLSLASFLLLLALRISVRVSQIANILYPSTPCLIHVTSTFCYPIEIFIRKADGIILEV